MNTKKAKKSVFEVAAEVFHRKGYDNTSMSDVATAAGLTKAGLYHHVSSKESLLEERNLEVTGLLHECKTLSTPDRARINRRKKEYVRMTTRLVADVIKKHHIKDVDPKVAAFALLGMLNWTYQWYKTSGSSSREQIVETFQHIFLQGILGHVWTEELAARAAAH